LDVILGGLFTQNNILSAPFFLFSSLQELILPSAGAMRKVLTVQALSVTFKVELV